MSPAQLQSHIDAHHTTWPDVNAMLERDFSLSPETIRAWRESDRDLVELMVERIERDVREEAPYHPQDRTECKHVSKTNH